MIAVAPYRLRISSRAASRVALSAASSGRAELRRKIVAEVGDRDPDQRQTAALDHRLRGLEQAAGGREEGLASRRRVRQRVRARRAREVARSAAAGRPCGRRDRPRAGGAATRSTSATSVGVELRRATVRDRPSARCDPIERRRRPVAHGPRIAVVGQRVQVAARGPSEHRRPACSRRRGRARRRSSGRGCVASPRSPGRRPRAARPAAGAGTRARSSGGTTSSPSGLATRARHLGQELRARDAHRDRQADLLADAAAQRAPRSRPASPRSRSSPRTSRNASSIDSPSTSGVVSSKIAIHRLARLARRPSIRGGTTTACGQRRARLPAAHRRADAVRLAPRSSPRARRRRRRSPAGRGAGRRRAARPRRRTRRGRHGGSSPA